MTKQIDESRAPFFPVRRGGRLSAWFRDQQRTAWKQFRSAAAPTRKDQAWRFSNVDLLDLSPSKFSAPISEDEREKCL